MVFSFSRNCTYGIPVDAVLHMVHGGLAVKSVRRPSTAGVKLRMPINVVDDEGFTWVVLDQPVDDSFLPRLVVELLAVFTG